MYQNNNTPYYTLPKRKQAGITPIKVILAILVLAVGFSVYQNNKDQNAYTQAHQWYIAGDCKQAIPSFITIIDDFRLVDLAEVVEKSKTELADCQNFAPGDDLLAQGKSSEGILYFNQYTEGAPISKLLAPAKQRMSNAFATETAANLATIDLCDQLETLKSRGFIPSPTKIVPDLYYQCGLKYESQAQLENAVSILGKVAEEYPTSSIRPAADTALARILVQFAKNSGGAQIPQPSKSGSTGNGSTVVIIQNGSSQRMRIVFSGATSIVEEVDACLGCTKFTSASTGYCPSSAPIGRFTLPAGTYDVVVQAVDDPSVTPWQGNWGLIRGEEYSECFFITTE